MQNIFDHTIYRLPTKEELDVINSLNLSKEKIINGFGYTIIGKGKLSNENKQMIIDSIQLLSNQFPNNKIYADALTEVKAKYNMSANIKESKIITSIKLFKEGMDQSYGDMEDLAEAIISEYNVTNITKEAEIRNLILSFPNNNSEEKIAKVAKILELKDSKPIKELFKYYNAKFVNENNSQKYVIVCYEIKNEQAKPLFLSASFSNNINTPKLTDNIDLAYVYDSVVEAELGEEAAEKINPDIFINHLNYIEPLSKFINESSFTSKATAIGYVIERYANINTVDDVKNFFNALINELDLNFHCDEDFNNYYTSIGGTEDMKMFTEQEANILNGYMDKCFEVCKSANVDVYEIGLDLLKKRLQIVDEAYDNLDLTNFDLKKLDPLEKQWYDNYIKSSTKEEALQIIINTVDGDYTQLSPALAKIAAKQNPNWMNENNSQKLYSSHGEPSTWANIKKIETTVRKNYSARDFNKWVAKYNIKPEDKTLWVTTNKNQAVSYMVNAEDYDNVMKMNDVELNAFIKKEKLSQPKEITQNGILIKESEDGEDGYLFVLKLNNIKENKDMHDWYCPSCNAYVSGEQVTFDEIHDTCGTPVYIKNEDELTISTIANKIGFTIVESATKYKIEIINKYVNMQNYTVIIDGIELGRISLNHDTISLDLHKVGKTRTSYYYTLSWDQAKGKEFFGYTINNGRIKKDDCFNSVNYSVSKNNVKVNPFTPKKIENYINSELNRLNAMNKNITKNEMKDFNYYLENLDKIGKEDIDINNDGKVDKSDFYLLNKRRKIKKAIKENVGDPKNYEKAFGIWNNFNMLIQIMDEGLINYDLTITDGYTLDDINNELKQDPNNIDEYTNFDNMDEFNKFINECKIHLNLHINENMESDNKAKLLKLADVMYNAVKSKFMRKPYENAGQKELSEFESKVRMAGLSYKDECQIIKYANDKIDSIEL